MKKQGKYKKNFFLINIKFVFVNKIKICNNTKKPVHVIFNLILKIISKLYS
jgi:hypothetical protein